MWIKYLVKYGQHHNWEYGKFTDKDDILNSLEEIANHYNHSDSWRGIEWHIIKEKDVPKFVIEERIKYLQQSIPHYKKTILRFEKDIKHYTSILSKLKNPKPSCRTCNFKPTCKSVNKFTKNSNECIRVFTNYV